MVLLSLLMLFLTNFMIYHFNMQVLSEYHLIEEREVVRVVCAMRSFGSMPNECMNHVRPKGEHTLLSAYGQCSKRDRLSKPTKSRALINYNAVGLSHAAKRLSVAKRPSTRLSYKKSRSKNARRLAMRARTCSARPGDVTLSYEYMQRLACSVCLFEFYCYDKDIVPCNLSVIHNSHETNTF